jgi:tRNA (cmo5U34)-methyltransferase
MELNVGDGILSQNSRWNFAGNIPETFSEHIGKSVPLYHEGHKLITALSDFFVTDNSTCYDLGCSTGLLSKEIALRNANKNIKLIAVDSEIDMISHAKKSIEIKGLTFVHLDLNEVEFEKADFIVAYYTIQFIKPRERQLIFNKIYEALNWGGAFILFEKVRGLDARFQDITTSLYTDYKLEKGYSPDNIISKARSLKGVLEPFSTNGNMDLMARAGFTDIMTIMKYICFEGFLAIK